MAIIGGTRFIGHAAAAALIGRGHQVAVIHRGRHRCELEGATDLIADRNHPQKLIAALRKADPEVVIDTWAMTRSHAEVTAMALKILAIPAVVLSSMDVYAQFGRLNGHPCDEIEERITEDSSLTVPYPFRGIAEHPAGEDYDKKDVEAVFRKACEAELPATTVLRLPVVYGARDPKRRFGAIVDRLDAGRYDLPQAGGAAWRLTHAQVGNVAQAIALSAESPGEGYRLFNVGERRTPTMRDRVEAIAAHMGVGVSWRAEEDLPADLAFLGEMPNDVILDSSAIREALGFEEVIDHEAAVVDLVDGLRRSRDVMLH